MVPAFWGLSGQDMTDNNAETVSNGGLSQGNNLNTEKDQIKTSKQSYNLNGQVDSVENLQNQFFKGDSSTTTTKVSAATSYRKSTNNYLKFGSSTISSYGIVKRPELSNLSGLRGLDILAAYINKNLNHRYGASTSASGVERTGYGDCWGLSDWSAQVLVKNGYDVNIVQGASPESARHRWLEVKVDGSMVRFDPTMVTKKYGSKHYSTNIAKKYTTVASYKGEKGPTNNVQVEESNNQESNTKASNEVNSVEQEDVSESAVTMEETNNSLESVPEVSESANNVEQVTEDSNSSESVSEVNEPSDIE
ncbi:MAG: transglutaminase domain-containing protein [Methanomicrobiales archaeon]